MCRTGQRDNCLGGHKTYAELGIRRIVRSSDKTDIKAFAIVGFIGFGKIIEQAVDDILTLGHSIGLKRITMVGRST